MYLNAMKKVALQRGISMEELAKERRLAMEEAIRKHRSSGERRKEPKPELSAELHYLGRSIE